MSMLDRITGTIDTRPVEEVGQQLQIGELAEILHVTQSELERVTESLADLELAHDDAGWRILDMQSAREFSRSGLTKAAAHARIMALANPLIRRGINLRTAYVWGQGVEISARATGQNDDNDTEQDVNAVVQAFLDDPATRKVLTGALAQQLNEKTLATDGMIFLALFTNPRLGGVQPRDIDADEIVDLIRNPEDRTEVWFYKRQFSVGDKTVTRLHPDVSYRPSVRIPSYRTGAKDDSGRRSGETVEIVWDAPVASLIVNPVNRWGFGVGDVYSSLPWARAYKESLEDWAKLIKSLSRYAWRLTADKRGKAQNAAAAARANAASHPEQVGGMATMTADQRLEAIPKTGATIDSESFRPIAAMVAAALDVPVTMLLADPGVTGARATAETLDGPTEDMANMRREVWGDYVDTILSYVVDAAVRAPSGPLQGTITRDYLGREIVTLAGDTDRSIDTVWPDLTETPVNVLMQALDIADGIGGIPPVTMLRLVLQALKVRDIDDVIDEATDDDGNLVDHDASAGDEAVKRFRNGDDPAAAT